MEAFFKLRKSHTPFPWRGSAQRDFKSCAPYGARETQRIWRKVSNDDGYFATYKVDRRLSFCSLRIDMEPVVSSPIIIPQIPTHRFSEEHLDEYRDESVEIFVEHPLPSRITLDLLEDSLSPYCGSYGSLRSFTPPPPPSCWDRFWSWICY
jgi:hypothetical protein